MRFRAVGLLVLAALGASPCAAADAIVIPEWRVIGPFEAGSREGLVHHLADASGRIDDAPDLAREWPSALAPGGRVAWKIVAASPGDDGRPTATTRLAFPDVAWAMLEDQLGSAGLANVAYLHSTFTTETPRRCVLEAARCVVRLNGATFAGDPYGAGVARSVVETRAGVNTLLVSSAGFGDGREVTLRLVPVEPDAGPVLVVESDVLLPDLVEGRAGSGWAAVPIVNLTNEWIAGVAVRLASAHLSGDATLPWPLAPRATIRVPVKVEWTAPDAGAGDEQVAAVVATRLGTATARSVASVVAPSEVRVETFRSSIDGSAQPFGVLPAAGAGATGLILSLHGAGVPCRGQASAYSPFEWAAVVAPQGRRPYGFDWHDWSERDALEALAVATERLHPDPARVVLAGQSMGGHGAWVLGCHRPDLFSMMTPAAAWISYDSVVPFTLRRSTHEAPAELQALLLQALAPGRVGGLLDNLESLPVRAFHGGVDDNIPTWNERWLVGSLERRGFDARLCELPEKKHWSDLNVKPEEPEGCADVAALHEEWRLARRDPWPKRVVIVTTDPDVGGDRAWLRLESQQSVARETRVEGVVVDAAHVTLTTRNAGALSLDLAPALGLAGTVTIDADGTSIAARADSRVGLARRGVRWSRAGGTMTGTIPQPGGLAKAIRRPFLVVAGTRARAARSLDVARLVADAWWVRAGGLAPIVRDVDLTDELRAAHDLVLVGSPDVNGETATLAKRLAVTVDADGASVAGRRLAGRHLASAHWQPDPRASDRVLLVLQGSDDVADDLLVGLHPMAPGAGLPDWVVASPLVRLRGWGGFRAAGFWTPGFRVDPANSWGLR